MAKTLVTAITPPAAYASAGVAMTFTPLDATDGGDVRLTGTEIVIVRNVNASSRTVTVAGVASAALGGRTGTQAIALAQDAHAVLGPFVTTGWQQSNGRLNIGVSGAGVEVAVLRLPR